MSYKYAERAGHFLGVCALAIVGFTIPLAAQDNVEEIVVTGSRTLNRSVLTTPSPVDVLGQAALEDTAQSETGRAIQNLAPSFNFPSTSIADGTDALKPATLRGLSPDQTLVLVNGKRRHKSALIHVNTSVGRGTAGTDMNAIAPSFVESIEILRDGASAQYGSDAIAGVINLKLREITDWNFVASVGQTTESDGETVRAGVSKGFEVGDGHIFWGFEYRDRGKTNRSGLSGTRHYQAGNVPIDQFPSTVDVFTSDPATCNANDNSGCDPRESTIDRRVMIVGDAESEHISAIVSGGGEVGPVRLDGFLHISMRDNQSTGFFREPDDGNRNVVAIYPNGFLPEINTSIEDIAYNFVVGWDVGAWEMETSYTYGENTFDFDITNSLNASFGDNSPKSADSGGLAYDETTINYDARGEIDGVVIAVGAELKTENFAIRAGEPLSWANCNNDRERALVAAQYENLADAANCHSKAAGIQVFPGFRAAIPAIAAVAATGTTPAVVAQPAINGAALDRDRDSLAAYAEVSYAFDNGLVLDGALRWEDYDGFGNAISGKFSLFYEINDMLAVRSTVSNGFRAPSMHQLYFNTISTFFIDGIPNETLIASNDSPLARALQIPELQEETSFNLGLGFVVTPADNFDMTIDFYNIEIDDRITLSGQIRPTTTGLSAEAIEILTNRNVSRARFFINATDTITRGIDIVGKWAPERYNGDLTLKFAWNFTETKVDGQFNPPGLLETAGGNEALRNTLFSQRDIDILERWQPRERASLTIDYVYDDWTFSTQASRYGEFYATSSGGTRQVHDPAVVIDFRAHWQITETTRLSFLGDNIFDQYPEPIVIGQSHTGTIKDIVDSPQGVFVYSRATAPYGFNGTFIGVSVQQSF